MAELKYEIIKKIGVIGVTPTGWTKELNLISWSGREAKYDIRDWSPERSRMGRGITLTKEELTALLPIIEKLE